MSRLTIIDSVLATAMALPALGVQAFFTGQEYLYQLVKQLSGGR